MDSDQGKLFVGGISWETTEEQLRDYFQRFGEIVETVIMKDRNTGRARGFGFVSFADPSAADMAVSEKHTINGRSVEAKKAVPRDEQQTIPRSSISSGGQSPGGSQGRTKKIFVGGLASTVTEEEFRGYFEQFGTISDAVVMYDHTTQRPRGFGFITFDSEDSVEAVLMKSFHELKDKMVEVKRAIPRDQTPVVKPVNTLGGMGMGRAYGQGYPTPQLYAGRPDARYGAMAARGGYAYPAGGYPGYAGAGYMMNGGYGGGYPAGYAAAGAGYGGAGYGNGGGNSPGYGSNLSRSAWPGGYGSSQGYGGNGGAYGGAGAWGGSGAQAQAGGSGGYGGGYYGENGYGSNAASYGGRGYGGSPGGYGSTGTGPGSGSYGSGYNNGYGDGYGYGGGGGGNWSGDGHNGYKEDFLG